MWSQQKLSLSFNEEDLSRWWSGQQRMKLISKINIVDPFGSWNDSFVAFFIQIQTCNWVIQIHFQKTGCRFGLQNICAIVPKIQIAVCWSDYCPIAMSSNGNELRTTNFASPCDLIGFSADDEQLAWDSPAKEISMIVVIEIVARSNLRDILILLFAFYEQIIILKLFFLSVRPEMYLITANSRKL